MFSSRGIFQASTGLRSLTRSTSACKSPAARERTPGQSAESTQIVAGTGPLNDLQSSRAQSVVEMNCSGEFRRLPCGGRQSIN